MYYDLDFSDDSSTVVLSSNIDNAIAFGERLAASTRDQGEDVHLVSVTRLPADEDEDA